MLIKEGLCNSLISYGPLIITSEKEHSPFRKKRYKPIIDKEFELSKFKLLKANYIFKVIDQKVRTQASPGHKS